MRAGIVVRTITASLLLATPPTLFASLRADSGTAEDLRELGQHPVWLKLLHYDRDSERSEVLSPDFFLADDGAMDSVAELRATLVAYSEPWGDASDEHARCRFPARYYWLAQQVEIPGYRLREPRCVRFETWALLDEVDSVSLLLVSGFFGNPASTFGHSLLRFNTAAEPNGRLLDLTLNFGALVPDDESTVVYVVRGLSGGYQAGFSDRYFYTQDQVYSRTEFRDIWDYELELSQGERTFLLLHTWEIVGRKFRYFFIRQNCAYRIAELLELVTGEPFLARSSVWYAPIEVFHRLQDFDDRRRAETGSGLISSVTFVPSSQRILFAEFGALDARQADAANEIIFRRPDAPAAVLAEFDTGGQREVLDAALAYYRYRLAEWAEAENNADDPLIGTAALSAEDQQLRADLTTRKDRVLLTRLRLPAGPIRDHTTVQPSPADHSRPMRIGVGTAREQAGDSYLSFRLTPFIYERMADDGASGEELVIGDLRIGFDRGRGIFLDQIDIIRVRKLADRRVALEGESRFSWSVSAGIRRVGDAITSRNDGFARFAAGRAWRVRGGYSIYAMVDVAAHSTGNALRLQPQLGLVGGTGSWRTDLVIGMEDAGEGWTDTWRGRVEYRFASDSALLLEVSDQTSMQATLSLVWYL